MNSRSCCLFTRSLFSNHQNRHIVVGKFANYGFHSAHARTHTLQPHPGIAVDSRSRAETIGDLPHAGFGESRGMHPRPIDRAQTRAHSLPMRPLKPPSGRDLMTIQSMTYGKMSKILDQAVFGEMGNFLPTLGEAVGRCLPLFANPH